MSSTSAERMCTMKARLCPARTQTGAVEANTEGLVAEKDTTGTSARVARSATNTDSTDDCGPRMARAPGSSSAVALQARMRRAVVRNRGRGTGQLGWGRVRERGGDARPCRDSASFSFSPPPLSAGRACWRLGMTSGAQVS
jgi:hypothetical protein